ncbi:MAG: alkane 1-monooxygenase [Ahrensia sp.]|nr:alkane 1-monooxygenase [Ahrensia sp.]
MIFVAKDASGEEIRYRDTKRYLWVLSFTPPLMPLIAIIGYFWSGGQALWTIAPLVYAFALLPLLDMLVGKDTTNPPSEIVEAMSQDNYYRVLLHLSVPIYWAGFLVSAWFVGTQDLPWWGVVAIALSAAVSSGTGITIGHELGHKQSRFDQFMAMLANAITGYGHFCVEHNRGHHSAVATPEDPASARFNESVYAFAAREIPGTLRRGWVHERERLARRGLPFWHWRNETLQGYTVTLMADVLLILAFGWIMIPFLIIHNGVGWLMLTQANYVEHYGLKRRRKENGRYEPCQPHHSWNTNHIVSNLMLFHLQRHSDHHANPMRPYQALRNFDDLPHLPSGYPGSFALAAFPPLWFRIMNPKVLHWADGDMDQVNTG